LSEHPVLSWNDGNYSSTIVDDQHRGRVIGFVFEYNRLTYQQYASEAWKWDDPSAIANGIFYVGGSNPGTGIMVVWGGRTVNPAAFGGVGAFWETSDNAALQTFIDYYTSDLQELSIYTDTIYGFRQDNFGHDTDQGGGFLNWMIDKGPGATHTGQIRPLGYFGVGLIAEGEEPQEEANYCASVSPIGSDLEAFNEMIPVLYVGEPSCTGVSEITIPLSLVPFFGWQDIVVPAVQVCFEPVSLGAVILLGVQINLDTILFIIGAVAVLLWFLRS
jgi:hypothetical protein